MAMPKRGSRLLVVGDWPLRWRVRYDRLHWSKGYASPVRMIFEHATQAGPRLVVEFFGCRRDTDDPLREPFTPAFARRLVEAGLGLGWRPGVSQAPDIHLDQSAVLTAMRDK